MFILLYYTDHHIILYPDWGHYHDQYHNYDVHYHQNYNYHSVTMLILSDYHILYELTQIRILEVLDTKNVILRNSYHQSVFFCDTYQKLLVISHIADDKIKQHPKTCAGC